MKETQKEPNQVMQKQLAINNLLTPYLAVFPNCKIDSVGLVLYSRALLPLSLAAIDAAMTKLLQTSVFFPTVAEIFKEADKMEAFAAAKHTGNAIPTAAEAWEEVQGLVKEFYVYRKWEFSCQQVEKAARRFGIYELCTLESDAVNTARAQFMRIYDSIVSQGQENRQNQRALNAMNPKSLTMLTAGITKQLSECGGM